ncbi:MAG: antitoxin VapB family protein [Nitrososphaera sp.]
MKTYNKECHKQIMVDSEVYKSLASLKKSVRESFNDVIRGLLGKQQVVSEDLWKITHEVRPEFRLLWESDIFAH